MRSPGEPGRRDSADRPPGFLSLFIENITVPNPVMYGFGYLIQSLAELAAAIGYPLAAIIMSAALARAGKRAMGSCTCGRRCNAPEGVVAPVSDHHRDQAH